MSEHIQRAIDEFEAAIAKLTNTVENLRWFQREFPHTAAAVTIADTPRRTDTLRAGPAKAGRKPKAAKKNDRQTDRQTEQRACHV